MVIPKVQNERPYLVVDSPNVVNNGNELIAQYIYRRNHIEYSSNGQGIMIRPQTHEYEFRTNLTPARTGLLLVGLGGNNGSTVLGATIANRECLSWRTKNSQQSANYWGSITQATTVHIGWDGQRQVHVPFNRLLPMIEPNSIVIHGWDINNANMYDAMRRAKVFEPELQDQLRPYMESIVPLPSIYYPDFIASNQESRVNHLIADKSTKKEHLEHIRNDIRQFKAKHNLECVIVLWTANTERFADIRVGLNTTADELIAAIEHNDSEIAPSHIFAVAALLERAHFINGSPQNTLVPGIIELATRMHVFVGGDDFKSGQTKIKSVLVDFLVGSGIKPESIVSYNHLGNNDGKNLSEAKQFRSKEITKSSVVDDMVAANHLLYPNPTQKPDHVIVIKYVPFVGDSKRAMDEYTSSIFMGGIHTLVLHNTCEDSLLAAPLILDLAIITELCSRIQYRTTNGSQAFESFDSVLSLLSALLKAPVVPDGTPVGNALMRQLSTLTKMMCICAGIASDCDVQLEFFTKIGDETKNGHRKAKNCEEIMEKSINGIVTNGYDH